MLCVECKKEIVEGASFCRYCGTPVKFVPNPQEQKKATLQKQISDLDYNIAQIRVELMNIRENHEAKKEELSRKICRTEEYILKLKDEQTLLEEENTQIIDAFQADDVIHCPNPECNSPVAAGQKFCGKCGAKIQ